ncbi:hypothetical protein RFM99_21045 [Mesorhizobium sp. VK4C]|nr:hypothetical protein [Mesorhizobium sp. VK4C]MDX8500886.1 hypothetical protein [Mesorhizobium sp. VK4C]
MEKLEQFRGQECTLLPVFLGQAALVAQAVKHPLEHIQISGPVDSTGTRH